MSEATLQDLLAQQRAIGLALASHERPRIEAARQLLASEGGQAFLDHINTIAADMPEGQAKRMLANIQTVLTAAPNVLDQEAARIDAILTPPPPPAAPVAPPIAPPAPAVPPPPAPPAA